MLPPDFRWFRRYENAPPGELALHCGSLPVAQLMQKVDGRWYVLLSPLAEPLSPTRARDCASRESGIAGVEAWATRHADRLREQAAIYASRLLSARHPAVSPPP